MEEGTAAEGVFTEAAAVDFMEAEGFTAAEVLVEEAEAALVSSADIRMAGIAAVDMGAEDIEAATTVVEAIMEAAVTATAAGVTAMAAEVGAMAATAGAGEAGVGAGDLAMAGLIGDMAGDILTATTDTVHGITRPTPITIRTRPTGPRTT